MAFSSSSVETSLLSVLETSNFMPNKSKEKSQIKKDMELNSIILGFLVPTFV